MAGLAPAIQSQNPLFSWMAASGGNLETLWALQDKASPFRDDGCGSRGLAVFAGKSAGLAAILARPRVVIEIVLIDPYDLARAMGFRLGLGAILSALRLCLRIGGFGRVAFLRFLFGFSPWPSALRLREPLPRMRPLSDLPLFARTPLNLQRP